MLSPIEKNVIYLLVARTSLPCNLPFIIIWGYSDAAATKYRLTFNEILHATREDCTVGDHQILGNACVRNYNKELVAHPEREERPVSP